MTRSRNFGFLLLVLDLVAGLVVFNLVNRFRGVLGSEHMLLQPWVTPLVALVIAIYLIEGYQVRTDMLNVDYASQHTIALAGATLATLLLTFAFSPAGFELAPQSSRIVIGLSFVVLIPLTLTYRRGLYLKVLSKRGQRALVFVGDRPSAEAFRQECQRLEMRQQVIYAVINEQSLPPMPIGGELEFRLFDEVLDELRSGQLTIEAIVLRESARELTPQMSRDLVQFYFAGIPTYTLELFHELYWQKIPTYRLNQTWLFQGGFPIAREPVFARIKRATDIFLALIGLALAVPFIALSALAIWIDDRGPIFFRQTRVGHNHVPFPLIKLRTMRAVAGGDLYTRKGDARITRVGKFLRASRLDELPQMWNVLVGDMSLIGPRAEWDRLVENYEREIPCYHFRHLVKPGITGWAQVNYPYGANREDTIRKLEYDLYYLRHFSFRLDCTIILKTIHIMLFGKGR